MPFYGAKTQTSQNHKPSKVLTPNSLDSSLSKQKHWMASASKHLGLSNPKTRKSTGNDAGFQRLPPSPYATLKRPDIPSHIPIKRKSTTPATLSSPIPYKRQFPKKPLPSLPIATIVSKSPVHRRSLIDATERPLRRSLSPQPEKDDVEEWPALSPQRPLSGAYTKPEPIKLSLGESVLGGMRDLNIGSSPCQDSVPDVCNNKPQMYGEKIADPILQPKCTTPLSEESSESSIEHTGSVNSLITSGAQRYSSPVLHQTKPSTTRARLSSGSFAGDHKNDVHNTSLCTVNTDGFNEGRPSSCATHSTGGPVRSFPRSRSRHAATPRGSPYLVQSRSKAKLVNVKRSSVTPPDGTCTRPNACSGSTDSTEEDRQSKVVAVKAVKPSGLGQRKTSIPLSSRLIRRSLPNEGEEALSDARTGTSSALRDEIDDLPQVTQIDTDSDTNRSHPVHRLEQREASRQEQQSGLISFSEMMAAPLPASDELHHESDSDQGSVHRYDEDGGFKIKKIGSSNNKGAILRIADDAHRFLSPDHEDEPEEATTDASKRSSMSDLRSATVLKEHIRRSSGMVKSQLQLTRSQTERSLARLSGLSSPNGDEDAPSLYSVPDNAGLRDDALPSAIEPPGHVEHGNDQVLTPTHMGSRAIEPDTVVLPSSAKQSDWPFKDFSTFAAVNQVTPATTDASPWIPPPNWDVNMDQADNSVISEVADTVFPPVPHNTPAGHTVTSSQTPIRPKRSSEASDRIPTPTPSYAAGTISRPISTDPIKRPFPLRTSSKNGSSQQPKIRIPTYLSPVKESPDRVTGLRQARKSYGTDMCLRSDPRSVKTFSESIEDINRSLDKIQVSSPATTAPPASSGKKAMSTLRGLLHKKSRELRFGSRRGKKPVVDIEPKSSPLMATPTPYYRPSTLTKGLSPLYPDTATSSQPGSHVRRKPVSAFKTDSGNPAVVNATLESPEIRLATQTAMKVLDKAREEEPGVRQSQLVELGKATINIVNAARETEKALEQAKQAVAKAEIAALSCRKAVGEAVGIIEGYVGIGPGLVPGAGAV